MSFFTPPKQERLHLHQPAPRATVLRLRRGYLAAMAAAALYGAYFGEGYERSDFLSALAIVYFGLLPMYIWAARGSAGFPIFPVHALLYIPAFAIPLFSPSETVLGYTPADRWTAALTVVSFLISGTFVWKGIERQPQELPEECLVMRQESASNPVLVGLLTLSIAYSVNFLGGYLNPPPTVMSIVRAGAFGLGALAVFLLSYRAGRGFFNAEQKAILLFFLVFYFLSCAATLFLSPFLITLVPALLGYALGRQRIPFLMGGLAALLITVLHYGKTDMREIYWKDSYTLGPTEYPAFYAQWLGFSYDRLTGQAPVRRNAGTPQSITERVSLIQLLMLVQTRAPDKVPYLWGATYKKIPLLILPRILFPDKPAPHEGQRILNVHFGVQSKRDVEKTYISWGLLNESVANFGLAGAIGLGAVLGFVCGLLGQWARYTPLLSFRGLTAILAMRYAADLSLAMGILVSSYFQSFVIVVFFSLVAMKRLPFDLEERRGTGLALRDVVAIPVRLRIPAAPTSASTTTIV